MIIIFCRIITTLRENAIKTEIAFWAKECLLFFLFSFAVAAF